MNFAKIKIDYNRRARIPYNKDLAPQVWELKKKFEEHNLDQVEVFTYKLFRDYLYWNSVGVRIIAQRQKVQEAILKYGKDSLFWEELALTEKERKDTLARMAYVCRTITTMLAKKEYIGVINRKDMRQLTIFLKLSVDFRKKLFLNPFTEKQWIRLWIAERILGIYWDDLSVEENGEVWRKDIVEKVQKRGLK